MRSSILAAVVLLLVVPAAAQIGAPPGGPPSIHGFLEVLPANGTIDRATGAAVLKLHRWRLLLAPGSNGIAPDMERVDVPIGDAGQDCFFLPPGSMVAHRRGKVFTYQAPRGTVCGIKKLRITAVSTNLSVGAVYRVDATLVGVVLSDLLFTTRPKCMSMAVIVGDDDGFGGIQLAEKDPEVGRRIRIANSCNPGADWPWLGQ